MPLPSITTTLILIAVQAVALCTLCVVAVLLYRHKRQIEADLRAEVNRCHGIEEQFRTSQRQLEDERQGRLSDERLKARRGHDRQLLQRSRDLERICKVSEAMLQQLPGRLLIEQGLRMAVAATQAEAGAVFMLDPRTQKLVFTSVIGEKAELLLDSEVPPGGSIAGAVLRSGKAELIRNAKADHRHNAFVDLGSGFRTRSMLVVPLRLMGEDPIGVLEVLNKHSGLFTQGDLQLLTAFATLLTGVVEHTRLYREHAAHGQEVAL